MRRRIDERHKRETRRTRIDLLIEGVTAIESVYRDALAAPAPALERATGPRCTPRRAPPPPHSTRATRRGRHS